VVFDGSASIDPDGKITSYTWDFGDGTPAPESAAIITHTYMLQGTYTAQLTVTDNQGAKDTAPGQPITVEAPSLPPILAEIEPPDGAVVRGTEVWVRWRSPLPATGRVLWHRVGEAQVRSVEAQGGEQLRARLGTLQDGQQYEYVVEQVIDALVQRSAMRTFTVEAGVAFDPPTVEETLKRDYDQTVRLMLRNSTPAPVTVAARALVQYDDLPADVVGPGSMDAPQALAPGQTLALRLAVFAPDATQEVYEIPVEAAGATATVHVRIAKPQFDLACRIVSEDARTLAKTIDIVNQGEPLPDLAVRIAPPHTGEVRLQPSVTHAHLEAGGIMRVVASPVLYLEFAALHVELEATAARQSKRCSLEFKAPPGQRLLGARSSSGQGTSCRGWYCTNRPTTCSECPGPVANGPATDRP
jgi:PKD repeat protein